MELDLDPGEGIVTDVFHADEDDSETLYMIAVYVGGQFSGHQIPLPEAILYPIPFFDTESQVHDPAADTSNSAPSECEIRLSEGSIRYPSAGEECTYVRILDGTGRQIGRWESGDWQSDAPAVLRAFLDAARSVTDRT